MVHYRGAVELQMSWYCSCLLLSKISYTIGEQLNYRWVDIAAACCYHKYGTLLGRSWTTDELILQLPVVITNMVHYWGAVEIQMSWYCSCLLLSQIWYTIGEQLNYRWVDIAAACCYHKYDTIWGEVALQVRLCSHKPKITEDRIFLTPKIRYINSGNFYPIALKHFQVW